MSNRRNPIGWKWRLSKLPRNVYFRRKMDERVDEGIRHHFLVKIYVKIHQNSPFLFCMDFQRANKEIVDPTYLWIGPNEKTLTRSDRINITKTGKLMVKDFLEALSGLYTCTLSYKTVKAETQEETVVKKRYDFMIFVNPFAPGWKSACTQSIDCEDITNHNILQWFVILGLLVLMLMLPVRPAFLFVSMELNLASKCQAEPAL